MPRRLIWFVLLWAMGAGVSLAVAFVLRWALLGQGL
jgi:hypothetical protein